MLSKVFDILLCFSIIVYTLYCTIYACRYLFSDIKKPFIGISSTYIFNYFVFDAVTLYMSCSGAFSCRENPLQINTIMLLALCQFISLYNGSLFLIKKYNFSKLDTEIRMTAFLQITQFMAIGLIVTMPLFKIHYEPVLAKDYIEWLYILNSSFTKDNYIVRLIFILLRFTPLAILSCLWVHSISKKYDKMEKSYFTKSANNPIYFFIVYESLFSALPYLRFESEIEFFIVLVAVYTLRLLFNKSVLKWLRHPDMEQIETNAILRSRYHA